MAVKHNVTLGIIKKPLRIAEAELARLGARVEALGKVVEVIRTERSDALERNAHGLKRDLGRGAKLPRATAADARAAIEFAHCLTSIVHAGTWRSSDGCPSWHFSAARR